MNGFLCFALAPALVLLVGACTHRGAEKPAESEKEMVAAKENPAPSSFPETPLRRTLEKSTFSTTEPVRLIARTAVRGDIDERSFKDIQKVFGTMEGVMAGALATELIWPTIYSPGMLVTGIPIVIALMAFSQHERAIQERIVQRISRADLVSMLRTEMIRNLKTSEADGRIILEILPLAYGVVESSSRQGIFCVVANILVTLRDREKELFRDEFIIHPLQRSEWSVVPVCRFRDVLADEQRDLITAALADYAAALPAFLERRVPGLPWKD